MSAPAGSPGLILVALGLVMTAGTLVPLALRRGDVPQPFTRPTRSRRFREIGAGGNANARGDDERALAYAGRAEVTVPGPDDARQDTYDRLPLRDHLDQEIRRLQERIDRGKKQRNELRGYLNGSADEDLRRLQKQIDRRLDDLSLIRDAVTASAPPTNPFRFDDPGPAPAWSDAWSVSAGAASARLHVTDLARSRDPRVPTAPRRRVQRGVRRRRSVRARQLLAKKEASTSTTGPG